MRSSCWLAKCIIYRQFCWEHRGTAGNAPQLPAGLPQRDRAQGALGAATAPLQACSDGHRPNVNRKQWSKWVKGLMSHMLWHAYLQVPGGLLPLGTAQQAP